MQVAEIFAYLCTQYGEKRGEEKRREGGGGGQKGKETVLFCCVLSCSVFAVAAIVCILCFLFCLSACLYVCLFIFLSLSLYFLLPRVLISIFFFIYLYREQLGQKIVIIRRCQNMPPFDVLLNNLRRRPVVWLFVCSFFLFLLLFFFFFFWYLIYTYSVFLHLDPAYSSFTLLIYFTCLTCLDFVYLRVSFVPLTEFLFFFFSCFLVFPFIGFFFI